MKCACFAGSPRRQHRTGTVVDDRMLTNTVGLHGEVAGIIGGTLPEIAAIELKALAAEVTNAADDGGAENAPSALTRDP